MMRAWSFILGIGLLAGCGGASSQPLTPDPDPTPTDQDIAALQNAQTSVADADDAGAANAPPQPPLTPKKSTAPKKP